MQGVEECVSQKGVTKKHQPILNNKQRATDLFYSSCNIWSLRHEYIVFHIKS